MDHVVRVTPQEQWRSNIANDHGDGFGRNHAKAHPATDNTLFRCQLYQERVIMNAINGLVARADEIAALPRETPLSNGRDTASPVELEGKTSIFAIGLGMVEE